MSRSFNLYRLQKIDTRLDRAHQRLAEIETLLADDAAVALARSQHASAEAAYGETLKALRTAEENTRALRIKIEQTESHLYSGRVSNPKELQDLQQEVQALRRYLETVEERQIEAMLANEEMEAAFQAAVEGLERASAARIETNAALSGELSRLQEEAAQMESERTAALNTLPQEDLAVYTRLRKLRSGVAVAEASGGTCSVCGTTLNAVLFQAVRSLNQLVFCDTCGRILYVG